MFTFIVNNDFKSQWKYFPVASKKMVFQESLTEKDRSPVESATFHDLGC